MARLGAARARKFDVSTTLHARQSFEGTPPRGWAPRRRPSPRTPTSAHSAHRRAAENKLCFLFSLTLISLATNSLYDIHPTR
ncbi:hypothetical protein B0H12DRAFT_1140770 [Mycena haematopus]|nr:hypothetical protein B0H12DRAFT_1140770 [Mycena haematopus]